MGSEKRRWSTRGGLIRLRGSEEERAKASFGGGERSKGNRRRESKRKEENRGEGCKEGGKRRVKGKKRKCAKRDTIKGRGGERRSK